MYLREVPIWGCRFLKDKLVSGCTFSECSWYDCEQMRCEGLPRQFASETKPRKK